MHFFDSSALAKLILDEAESPAIAAYLTKTATIVASDLARAELTRAVRRSAVDRLPRVTALFERLHLVPVTGSILTSAGRLLPPGLRTLDAIHLASALLLQGDLQAFVTYDQRQRDAAIQLGLLVNSPS
ncbi:MAG: type II toxin-antitoxin system VapC family toxin [Cryobacterium sp.]|nr:type II toxin-antitoxin system VapC family toxin [Cryobacterium sp.]